MENCQNYHINLKMNLFDKIGMGLPDKLSLERPGGT